MFFVARICGLVNSQISPVALMMHVKTFSVSVPYSVTSQTEARPLGVSTSSWFCGSKMIMCGTL